MLLGFGVSSCVGGVGPLSLELAGGLGGLGLNRRLRNGCGYDLLSDGYLRREDVSDFPVR